MSLALADERKGIRLQNLCTNYPHGMHFLCTPLSSPPSLLLTEKDMGIVLNRSMERDIQAEPSNPRSPRRMDFKLAMACVRED